MELDKLQIKIDANAAQANKSINNLIKKLLTLSTNLGSVDTGKLNNIASGIKSISDASAGFKGKSGKASEITSLANALKKFSNIDTTSLYGISSAMKNLSSGIGSIGSVNVTGMTNLISSISKLGGKNATQGAKNLITVKDDLVKFVQGMNSIGNLNFNTAGLSNLISSISRLGLKSTTQATKNLPTMSAQLQNFVRQMNNIGSSTFDTSTLLNLANAISRLGGKNVTQSIVNLPLLTKELINLFNALAKVPAVNQSVINMTNSIARLASTGSKSGTAVRSLSGSLNSYQSSTIKATKSSKGLVSQIGMFYARFFLAIRGVKQFWKAIESSMNYVEVLNYFNAAFGQVAENAVSQWKEAGYDSAEAYYDSFAKRAEQLTQKMTGYSVSESGMLTATGTKNMGINPSELMNYQAMFGQMSSSMGITSENALTLSNVLTEIGADLASVKNMDFNKVWEDMASGLAGMSRTLDKYGVNIRNVNLQQKLNELGIKANITALNQNEKALLRTIILLDSTSYAWGDLSDTINQPANQLRLLQSNFSNLARTIGNIFLPIVANVLPYLNGLAIALQRVAENIVKMLGFTDFDWGGLGGTKSSSDALSSIYDEADNTSDALDNATDSAKELKNQLLSFDEVDKLTEPTESKSSTKTGSGLDAAGSAALDKAFQDAASAYQKAWDAAFANMEQKSTDIADRITKALNEAWKNSDFSPIGKYVGENLKTSLDSINWRGIESTGKKLATSFATLLNGFFSTPGLFESIAITIANSLNTAIATWLTFSETFDFSNFGESIATGVSGFFSTFDFEQLANGLNAWVNGLKEALISFLSNVSWSDVFSGLNDFLGNLEIDTIAFIVGSLAIKKIGAVTLAKGVLKFIVTHIATKLGMESITLSSIGLAIKNFALNATTFISAHSAGLAIAGKIFAGIGAAIAGWNIGNFIYQKITGDTEKYSLTDFFDYSPDEIMEGLNETVDDWIWGIDSIRTSTEEGLGAVKEKWESVTSSVAEKVGGWWSNRKDDWSTGMSYIKDEVITKFDLVKGEFTTVLSNVGSNTVSWWSNRKDDWKTGMGVIKDSVSNGMSEVGTKFGNALGSVARNSSEWWSNRKSEWSEGINIIKGAFSDFWQNHASKWFDSSNWNFSGIGTGLSSAFNGAIEAVKKIWNTFAEWLNDKLTWEIKPIRIMGKKIFDGATIDLGKIPTFETGGFPEDGMFFANHNELVGQFSNGKTAVANNDQITAGIERAAYNGMKRALAESNGKQSVNISLEANTAGLFKAVQKEADNYTRRTGESAFVF